MDNTLLEKLDVAEKQLVNIKNDIDILKERIKRMKSRVKYNIIIMFKDSLIGIFKGVPSELLIHYGAEVINIKTEGTVVGKTYSAIIDDKLNTSFPINDSHSVSLKYDGTCVLYYKGVWYIKQNINAKTAEKWINKPKNLHDCIFFPEENNKIRVYWTPMSHNDKWHCKAFPNFNYKGTNYITIYQNGIVKVTKINPNIEIQSFELVGPKVQSGHYIDNPFPNSDIHYLIPHGRDVLESFNTIKFIDNPYSYASSYIESRNIEGVVIKTAKYLFKINRNSIKSHNKDKFNYYVCELETK